MGKKTQLMAEKGEWGGYLGGERMLNNEKRM